MKANQIFDACKEAKIKKIGIFSAGRNESVPLWKLWYNDLLSIFILKTNLNL